MRRLVKRVIIAKSGIYEYRAGELPRLELTANEVNLSKDVYRVYRPAVILAINVDKFTSLPLLYDPIYKAHPDDFEDQRNWNRYGIGMTGDKAELVWDENKLEVAIKSSLTIVGDEGFKAYSEGIVEVSPGYYGQFIWNPGITSKGEEYDIIMIGIKEVDHLVMTEKARGGQECKILDSKGGTEMPKILTYLLWRIKKLLKGVGDSDVNKFREIVTTVVADRAKLSDVEIANKSGELKNIIADLPDNDDKTLLSRYIDELPIFKDKSDEIVNEAGKQIVSLFEKLDNEAMQMPIITKTPEVAIATGDNDTVVEAPKDGCGSKDVKDSSEEIEPIKQENLEPIKQEKLEPIKDEGLDIELDVVVDKIAKVIDEYRAIKNKTIEDTKPAFVKGTNINSDKLENQQAGPDRVMKLDPPEDKTSDSMVDTSPVIDTGSSEKKEGLLEAFNKF